MWKEEPAKEIEKQSHSLTSCDGKERALLVAEEGFLRIQGETRMIFWVEGQKLILDGCVGGVEGNTPYFFIGSSRYRASEYWEKVNVIQHSGTSSPEARKEEGRNGDIQKALGRNTETFWLNGLSIFFFL